MESRVCKNCTKVFEITSDDFGFYTKLNVPAPTFCPDCRAQRRLVWRNNMSLYTRPCDACQKSTVSAYAPTTSIVQYCNKCWWGDSWDAKSFGREYDFQKPFFTQFKELLSVVPHIAMVNDNGIASINCEYTYDWWFAKNCYMAFSGWQVENVMYSFYVLAGRDMMDCTSITDKNEWLYECIDCERCYQLKYSQFAVSCTDSQFLYDCRGCSDCFLSAGLRNKKYCFKNEQYSKEEYESILASYRLDTYSGVERARQEYHAFILLYPRRYAHIVHSTNSTGDLLTNCKNTHQAFNVQGAENCKFYDFGTMPKDSYDISMTGEMSECYEGSVVDHSSRNVFGVFSVKSQDIRYTQHCHSGKHLFGCVGLRNAEYCILNKQYTKEEYEALVPRISDHMNVMPYEDKNGCFYPYGENYPIELSPFGYNETFANERFPLPREVAVEKGYAWQDGQQRTTGRETIGSEAIPETIAETSDTITKEILACCTCGRNYKIVAQEYVFYTKMNIPIPRNCFHCRHAARSARRNPFHLWKRQCMCEETIHGHDTSCANEFETSYAPSRKEIVYCESCYQKHTN